MQARQVVFLSSPFVCFSSTLVQEEKLLSLCFKKNSEESHFEPACHEATEGDAIVAQVR